MMESKEHRKQVSAALADQNLQTALSRAVSAYKKSRAAAMDGFDFEAAQREIRAIKERSIDQLDMLFARFCEEAEKVGAVVHRADDGEHAAEIVRRLAEERGVKKIVKSKSMLTEEIELNSRLQAHGLQITETDLGEWIIQLAGEKPSHFTAPAMHKTREQVAEIFSKETGQKQDADISKLVEVARTNLRQAFFEAEMGISGANIAIAETGSIVIVANEGNDRLVTTLPPIHVALVGYEKLVGTMDEANAILKVLSKCATGQKQTAYVSYITGPSRTSDIEKTITLGVHGPKELHIIFVDGGRKAMYEDAQCREALFCIKCGACLNMCPAYRSVGGHAFGNAYMGGLGAVVTAFHRNLEASADTLALCAGCGACTGHCPSQIDTSGMVMEMRSRLADIHGLPPALRLPLELLRRPGAFYQAARVAGVAQSPFVASDGMLRDLPVLPDEKRLPGLARRFLRDILPEQLPGTRTKRVSLYAGCMIDLIYPEIGEAIWKVMAGSGMRAMFPKDQACCGAPALSLGDKDTARKLAIDNILALERGVPHYIVTGCPTCAVMLKRRIPRLLEDTAWHDRALNVAKKVMDFARFAAQFADIRLKDHSGETVTFHESCHQAHSLKTTGLSRSLIEAAGHEIIDMREPRECCGFAGSYSLSQPGISSAILARKLGDIQDTGADVVATDCPGCILQIRGGLAKRGERAQVLHTAQIVAESMEQ